jgi:hypothetical protein
MKKVVIITLNILIIDTSIGFTYSTDSLPITENHRIALMYQNLDARLKEAELEIMEREIRNEEIIQRIDRRLERMEDKFDKYFLWGYGTLLSIFIGVLAWFLNKFRSESIREYHPPTSNLKVTKQKYLFPS